MRTKLAISVTGLCLLMMLSVDLSAQRGRGGRGGGALPPLIMETDAWEDGGIVPEMYAGRGRNYSPRSPFGVLPPAR